MSSAPKIYVAAFDVHYPDIHRPSWRAVLDFLDRNKVAGFIFGGDSLTFDEISHHTQDKPLFRERGSLDRNIRGFDKTCLSEVEKRLSPDAERAFLVGNHERFLTADLIETQPQLDGALDLDKMLRLSERGWKVVPQGGIYRIGKLLIVHGDGLGSAQNAAKKAVEVYCQNVLLGHHHCVQQFTKTSPAKDSKKWVGTVAPTLGVLNPGYGRNRPNGHLNGFAVIELWGDGMVNVYPIVIVNGKFSYGGVLYGDNK